MAQALDLTGHRYGMLTVISFSGLSKGRRPEKLWDCRCDCGEHKTVRQNNLRSGHTKSCGCHMRAQTSKANKKHGFARTPTYTCWRNMKSRCLNPRDAAYKNYGERGITVCDRWLKGFEYFLEDMGEKPGSEYSIERINTDGNYEPQNCKWATTFEQNRNYRKNVHIERDGRRQCLKDWASELRMKPCTLRARLKAGWSIEEAFYLPVSLRSKHNHRMQ
jgi:hypothetical protein